MTWWLQLCRLYVNGPLTTLIMPVLKSVLPVFRQWLLHLASKYHWSLIAVLCSLAAKVLISDDAAQADLDPAGWIKERARPASVLTFVSSLPDAQAHLLVFQLSAALSVVTDWAISQSPLLKPEDHLLFKHLRAMPFRSSYISQAWCRWSCCGSAHGFLTKSDERITRKLSKANISAYDDTKR